MVLDDRRRMLRDQLREARSLVLKDAEAFPEILFALERLALAWTHEPRTLKSWQPKLEQLAALSPLATFVPSAHRAYHVPFGELYDHVRRARNDAMHQGAQARHLARHAVELCMVLEDALVRDGSVVGDFMVRSPVCAEPWQPVSFVRQQMLANAFSFLPLRLPGLGWSLVCDVDVARYLSGSGPERGIRLARTLEDAINNHGLSAVPATCIKSYDSVDGILHTADGRPFVVTDQSDRLIGIMTAFDLL